MVLKKVACTRDLLLEPEKLHELRFFRKIQKSLLSLRATIIRPYFVSLRHAIGEVSQMPLRCTKVFNLWMSAILVGEDRTPIRHLCLNTGVPGRPDAVHAITAKRKIVRRHR